MPTIRQAATATSSDILSNVKFSVVPARGAILNLWGSSATNGDTFGLSIGDRDLIVNGTELNVEASADVIDTDRDQLLFNELVGTGQLFLPVTITTEIQFMLHLRYL